MINIKKKLGTAEVKKRRAFVAIYVMSFFFALSIALPTYINSSFLSRFILEKNVGIFYAIASLLSLLALIWIPSLLKKIGNYKREKGKLISDLNREKKIILGLTNKTKLDKKFIKEIYRVIFKFSKKVQK